MPRCNDCNKFVSLDTDVEPDESDPTLSFSSTADYDVNITIANNCAECGTELRTAELNLSGSFDIDIDEYDEDNRDNWTVEVQDLCRIERGEGKGRVKTFYGVECTFVLMDEDGNELERLNDSADIQASHMDEV
jgi:phosphate-selective porin